MRIVGLGTAVPRGSVDQAEAAAISREILARDARQARLVDGLYRRSGVERRHSVLLHGDELARQTFFDRRAGGDDRGPGTAARMAHYEAEAGTLAVGAATAALADANLGGGDITHLVTVSCTGFHAPGPELQLIRELGLSPEVGRFGVGFMGCHGAFNGLRLAQSVVRADRQATVLVCAVELCSLHFNYAWESEAIVANALFADGAAAFVCAAEAAEGALTVEHFGSCLVPDSEGAMSWRIGDHGFAMTLAAELPATIEQHLPPWLGPWLGERGVDGGSASWAVHPGGPRVLDAVERGMGLGGRALVDSRAVLADYGNMSSATIGFILDRQRASGRSGPGVALGFGPGLMIEAFSFRLP